MARLSAKEHADRADKHCQAGDALSNMVGSEWSAVCYFYSAYHFIRRRLLLDPIFDNLDQLKSINEHLIPDDRHTSRHKGRRGRGMVEFGVNELVGMLYKDLAASYEALHMASINVRYENGIGGDLDRLRDCLTRISVDCLRVNPLGADVALMRTFGAEGTTVVRLSSPHDYL